MNDANGHLLTLFAEALEAGTPQERETYLERVCAGDAELRARLEALLQAHEQAGGFLGGETAPLERGIRIAVPADAGGAGTVIGPYKLLQRLGEGGMGTVWLAEQTEPVKRRVALKLIKPGMDSAQVLARFEAERQALALMDHPNIARVFDAGTTESGRPYFVMELVQGVPLTRYCDEQRLTPRERLELFIPVCQAIQHAHQKGVIHRDIKPSNVLVTLYDGNPVPKVIDFGIAKAMPAWHAGVPQLTEHTLVTGFGTVIGTLEYMSPEQADFNQLDIDTRSDIYSLGVLLYELLTGSTPLQRKPLQDAGLFELLRLIREEEPPRPSTRLTTSEELAAVAANRGLEPRQLNRQVREELDWVVMKCLEKDRNRRYETANGLARDLQRYLADEPVLACPPSRRYRLQKFLRRHRGPVLAGTLVLLALVAGIVAATVGLVRADRALQKAEQSAEAEGKARKAREQTLTDMSTSFGLTAGERGDHRQAVLWFTHAARLAGDAERVETNQVRAAGWARLAPRPIRAVVHPAEWLQGAAFDPTGRHLLTQGLATAPGKGECQLWDLHREEKLPFSHAEGTVSAAAWDSKGERLALGTPSGPVRVCRFPAGELLQQIDFAGPVSQLLFSPDGRYLVAAGGSRVRVWDCRQAAFATPELRHTSPITTLAFHPQGRQLATACENHTCRLFSLPAENDQSLFLPFRHYQEGLRVVGQKPNAPVFVDGGRGLLTISGGIVSWQDTATGQSLRSLQLGGSVDAVSLSPDGRLVAVANPDRAGVWSAATGKQLGSFGLNPRPGSNKQYILALAFSPDSKMLATGGADHTARLWSVPDGKPVGGPLNHPTSVDTVTFAPEGRHLLTAARGGLVRLWELPADDLVEYRLPLPLAGSYSFVRLSRDGKHLLASGGSQRSSTLRSTQVHNVPTGEPAGPALPAGGVLLDADFSPDGQQAALAVSLERSGQQQGGRLLLWDWRQGRQVAAPLSLSAEPRKLDYSPDGRSLAVIDAQGQVVLVDPATGKKTRQWQAHDPHTANNHYLNNGAVRFTPDSRSVISYGTRANSARIWDVATGTRRFQLEHGDVCMDVQFSRDGKHVATASFDNTACVWELETGQLLKRLSHPDWVHVAVFSPDGKWLLTGCRDGMARLWDWQTGELVCPAFEHQHEVHAVAFTPDGRRILTTGDDMILRLWEATTGKPLAPPLPLPGSGMQMVLTPDGSRVAVGGFVSELPVFHLASWLTPAALVPDELAAWGEILSGQRVHEGGGVINLTAREWYERWQSYRTSQQRRGETPAYPPPAAPRKPSSPQPPEEPLAATGNNVDELLKQARALHARKNLDGASETYRNALRLEPNNAATHDALGIVLAEKKDLEGAIKEYETAIKLDGNNANFHYHLGNVFLGKKDNESASREFRNAIRLDATFPEAHCNLGHVLTRLGKFAEGAQYLKTGHQLGSQRPGWTYPSAEWVRQAERFAQLDALLAKVLSGESQPASTAERLELADLCQHPGKRLDAAAVRFFREAFAAEPALAEDPRAGRRQHAACAAVRAGSGLGKDPAIDEAQRALLRQQALDWLRADLAAWSQQLEKEPATFAPAAAAVLQRWQMDADLAGVRDPEALARLPEAERSGWQKLWQEVAALGQLAEKSQPRRSPVLVGQELDLSGPTVDGKTFDLKQLRGKVVLIDFWATWCGPCIAEMPNVKRVHERYHKDGFEVVGVSLDNSRDALLQYIKTKEVPWPQIFFAEKEAQGWNNPLAKRYEIHGIPATILVDQRGKVAAVGVRGAALDPTVARLLGKAPAQPPLVADPPGPAKPEPGTCRVTAATLQADPKEHTGALPARFEFRGQITVDGPGTVKYVFLRSDGARGPTHTLTFDKAGTKEVSTGWQLGLNKFAGWQALKVMGVTEVVSEKAQFKIDANNK